MNPQYEDYDDCFDQTDALAGLRNFEQSIYAISLISLAVPAMSNTQRVEVLKMVLMIEEQLQESIN